MKSEERQELKQNDLADWIYHVPAFLSKYGTHLLFALVIALLAFNLWNWYQREQTRKTQNAWLELTEAERAQDPPAQYNRLILEYDVRPVQALAYANLGDFYHRILLLGQIPPEYPAMKEVAPEFAMAEAQKAYNKVLADFADQPLAVLRAHMGLGRLYEAQGEFTKARAQYEKLTATDTPYYNPAFAAVAQERIDTLDNRRRDVAFGPPAATQPTAPVDMPINPLGLPGMGPELPGILPDPLPMPETAPAPRDTPATAPAN